MNMRYGSFACAGNANIDILNIMLEPYLPGGGKQDAESVSMCGGGAGLNGSIAANVVDDMLRNVFRVYSNPIQTELFTKLGRGIVTDSITGIFTNQNTLYHNLTPADERDCKTHTVFYTRSIDKRDAIIPNHPAMPMDESETVQRKINTTLDNAHVLSLHASLGEDAVKLAQRSKEKGLIVIADASKWEHNTKELMNHSSDIILPDELIKETPIKNLSDAPKEQALQLLEFLEKTIEEEGESLTGRFLAVSCGKEGVLYKDMDSDKTEFLEARQIPEGETRNTIGCGDVLHAAYGLLLTYMINQGISINIETRVTALRTAMDIASWSAMIDGVGLQDVNLGSEEHLTSLKAMVDVSALSLAAPSLAAMQ